MGLREDVFSFTASPILGNSEKACFLCLPLFDLMVVWQARARLELCEEVALHHAEEVVEIMKHRSVYGHTCTCHQSFSLVSVWRHLSSVNVVVPMETPVISQ